MTLRKVAYRCGGCDGVSVLRFALAYRPFYVWLMTCRRCGKYELHQATGRPLTGGFRGV